MRRGLGTDDPNTADSLVKEMNDLLSDDKWHTPGRIEEAKRKFSPPIFEAFFGELEATVADSASLREAEIPLPTKQEGYPNVLLVGSTGAGKTSLLRHLIGTDTTADRFPSTSTAKTTVSDMEIITADDEFYRAVVTFSSETSIQLNIEDCVLNACVAFAEGASKEKIAERFLNHPDQRFRLSYVLGSLHTVAAGTETEEDFDFNSDEENMKVVAEQDEEVSDSESQRLQSTLEDYIERIRRMTERVKVQMYKDHGLTVDGASAGDHAAIVDLLPEADELFYDEGFAEIVQDVLDDVLIRFDRFGSADSGTLVRRSKTAKWPIKWTFETQDRKEFLSQIRWFSSNFAPSFGKLLTPLVDGIRVKGPLFGTFQNPQPQPKLVLIDGQGLGHTPETATSLTTRITSQFDKVDVILLVDSATQPIQAGAQSVLRSVATSGHYGKLALAFTHFDEVKGLNLPTHAARQAHVQASVHNYLSKLSEILNVPVVAAMAKKIDASTFMLGALQGSTEKLPKGIKALLAALTGFFEKAIAPPPKIAAAPIYDPSGLGFAVRHAADSFQKLWAARLGLSAGNQVVNEHWTRIKALNRRVSSGVGVEYDSLRPVADLISGISEEISKFLDHPIKWEPSEPMLDEAQAAISEIRQRVFRDLHDLALRRLVGDRGREWRTALDYKGKGAAGKRAVEIRDIYGLAAPVPGTVNSESELQFLSAIRRIVEDAVTGCNGKIQLLESKN